jgi:hypothetical protein
MVEWINMELLPIVALHAALTLFWVLVGTKLPSLDSWYVVRKLAAVTGIEEAVRVCAEKGKPIIYSVGFTGIRYVRASMLYHTTAGVAKYLGRACGELNVPLICTTSAPDMNMILQDYSRQGFLEAGHPERFNPNNYYFLAQIGAQQMVEVELIKRLQVGAYLPLIQHSWGHHLACMDQAARVGAIQVGSECDITDLLVTAVNADYLAIADEQYAMGAYMSEDREAIGSVVGTDFFKIFYIALLCLATILFIAGVDIFP